MRNILLFLLTIFLVTGLGQELLRNGDFEDSLNYWTPVVNNNQGTYSITRDTSYQSDSDYEVRVYKSMRYSAGLAQTVDLASSVVRFSGSAKLLATKGSTAGHYAYAAIILKYLNAGDTVLGRTMIVKKVGSYNPRNSPILYIIPVTSNDWEDYELILADEIARLSGVNPADVAKVSVCLECYGTGSTG